MKESSACPGWLRVERLFGEWGIPKDSPSGREQFAAHVEIRRQAELEGKFKAVRRGWCLGSEEFRRELLAQVSEKRGLWPFGPELQESAQEKAERMVREELQRMGLREEQLEIRPKGDPFKVALALKLRVETLVSVAWIANRLRMGTRGHLTHLLYWHGKESDDQPTLGL